MIDIFNPNKNLNFYVININKVKRQPVDWGEVFVTYITNGSTSKILQRTHNP